MTINDYMKERGARVKPDAKILERWESRVVRNGWHTMGDAGADLYLEHYGRNIGAPKVIALAACAEQHGAHAMARRFWEVAYRLEFGQEPERGAVQADDIKADEPKPDPPLVADFPVDLQPGKVMTMQPVDAPRPREFYIDNPRYWGQPKRDGNRLVVFATAGAVYYQSRSLRLRQTFNPGMDRALRDLAGQIGAFVLDGELYYQDANGDEHRTGAQALTANQQTGISEGPRTQYAVFKALYHRGRDLRPNPEGQRIEVGLEIAIDLHARCDVFEWMVPAVDAETKRALAVYQEGHGKEGEVWIDMGCPYAPGKTNGLDAPMVRTKYHKTYDVVMLELTPTGATKIDRPWGAIRVGAYRDGKLVPCGSVGTGYTVEQMREIERRFGAGERVISVKAQGLTEGGSLWLASFVDFRDDKPESECVL